MPVISESESSSKTLVVITSDWHCNSTLGLSPPIINLDDGGTYRSSRGQRWLWEHWLDLWAIIADYRSHGYQIISIANGDLAERDIRRRTSQVISRNSATVLDIMRAIAEPMLDCINKLYIIRGTETHTGKSADFEEEFAMDCLPVVIQPDGVASWWHLCGTIGSTRLDIAHHVNMGGLPWTSVNAANQLAARSVMNYAIRGQKPPHLVIRSHVHRVADSGDNYPVRALITPAWQLKTAYAHRLSGEQRISDIGAYMILVNDTGYQVEKRLYHPEAEKRIWAIKL